MRCLFRYVCAENSFLSFTFILFFFSSGVEKFSDKHRLLLAPCSVLNRFHCRAQPPSCIVWDDMKFVFFWQYFIQLCALSTHVVPPLVWACRVVSKWNSTETVRLYVSARVLRLIPSNACSNCSPFPYLIEKKQFPGTVFYCKRIGLKAIFNLHRDVGIEGYYVWCPPRPPSQTFIFICV
jgi:hypothetical protein